MALENELCVVLLLFAVWTIERCFKHINMSPIIGQIVAGDDNGLLYPPHPRSSRIFRLEAYFIKFLSRVQLPPPNSNSHVWLD